MRLPVVSIVLLSTLMLFGNGCGSLLYNCKANDTQCKERVAELDRATTEIAIEGTAAVVSAAARAGEGERRDAPPPSPPHATTAAPSVVAAPAPSASPDPSSTGASTSASTGESAGASTGPSTSAPFDGATTMRELHVAVHFARMCRGDSVGAVSGKVALEPHGSVRVVTLAGPGVKDKVVLACVQSRLVTATIPPFQGDVRTASLIFDVDPDDDLPTPKEAEAPVKKK